MTVNGANGASIEPAGTPLADRVDHGVQDLELSGFGVDSARADRIVLSARASALVAAAPKALPFFIRDFDALDGHITLHDGRALVLDAGVYSIRPGRL